MCVCVCVCVCVGGGGGVVGLIKGRYIVLVLVFFCVLFSLFLGFLHDSERNSVVIFVIYIFLVVVHLLHSTNHISSIRLRNAMLLYFVKCLERPR